MVILREALPSPNIKDGVLSWYEGDVFELNIAVTLMSMGESYKPSSDDTMTVRFFDKSGFAVHEFSALAFDSGAVLLGFEDSVSAKLQKGTFSYDCIMNFADGRRTTVANDNPVCVM